MFGVKKSELNFASFLDFLNVKRSANPFNFLKRKQDILSQCCSITKIPSFVFRRTISN